VGREGEQREGGKERERTWTPNCSAQFAGRRERGREIEIERERTWTPNCSARPHASLPPG